MKKRLMRLITAALAILMVLPLAACGGGSGASGSAAGGGTTGGYKDTLTWGQGADVTSLDPHQ
ncbi:MAG: peptide-binding protein, partial [Oscillibacter sp.]|nr:peptide-binding protein [Oscillibacter sp.]